MPNFKIATWNVNSLRVRMPHILKWLDDVKPDVLALQETKICDPDFPVNEIKSLGYHLAFSGQKTYNGVAVISRHPIENITNSLPGSDDIQKRILGVTTNNLRILNLYVPNGEHVASVKYQYKLNWLKQLNNFLDIELKTHSKMIVLGDFNIAPEEIDVHSPKDWIGKVLFSEPERDAFRSLLNAGFRDCFRRITPQDKQFSWWDYRLNAFQRNLGLRIDHILASEPLAVHCTNCHIDKLPRSWERPSDHTPVIAEFAL